MLNSLYFKNSHNLISFTSSKVSKTYLASDSFLSKLDNMSQKDAYNYLISITSDKDISKKFIEEITKNPRDSKKNVLRIYSALGSKENFDNWYYTENGYMQAFHNYIEEFFENAKSIEELVSYMPSWGDWKLSEKSQALSGSKHYTVGKLPFEFGDKNAFEQLATMVKEGVNGDIEINGQKFSIKYPVNGLSGKIVAEINGKYILKTSFDKKYKADSPYYNMCVDYYLNANQCKNAAEFYFYDDKTDSVLYKKEQIIPLKYKTFGKDYFYNPQLLLKIFEDVQNLGIIYTDRGISNYTTNSKGNNISIDSGHSEYMDILKPGLTGYHVTLPSNTGFSQMSYNGILYSIADNN